MKSFNLGNFGDGTGFVKTTRVFSGTREIEFAPYLETSPTPGKMRISPPAAQILGVDYDKVLAKADERVGMLEPVKGKFTLNGQPLNTFVEEGKKKHECGFFIVLNAQDEDGTIGSKLSSPSKSNNSVLDFTLSTMYALLGGQSSNDTPESEDLTIVRYTVNEACVTINEKGELVTLEQAVKDGLIKDSRWTKKAGDEFDGQPVFTFFPLSDPQEISRKRRDGGDDDEDAVEEAEVVTEAEVLDAPGNVSKKVTF